MTRSLLPPVESACPCGSGRAYAQCCDRLHQGEPAANAEALMRSRYSAYVLKNAEYLLATWHPRTRPAVLELSEPARQATHWLGLDIRDHRQLDDQHAEVTFIARYRIGGGRAVRMVERSRFAYDGRWLYVDGEVEQR